MEPKSLTLPLTEDVVRSLHVGDMVSISGVLATGRDKLHKYLFHETPDKKAIPFNLEGSILYHCGPIVKDADSGGLASPSTGLVIAAGPTTSNRVEMYEPFVIERYGIRAVMGKGGMDRKTHEAMMKFGCVYLNTIGGAAAYLADKIKAIKGVWMLEEWGMAEAMWALEVEDFPAIVTMDTHGRSLHEEIERESAERLREVMG